MSNHEMSRAMSGLGNYMLDQYRAGNISEQILRGFFKESERTINWMDGTFAEFLGNIDDFCGKCLAQNTEYDFCQFDMFEFLDKYTKNVDLIGYHLCKSCAEEVLSEYNRQNPDNQRTLEQFLK